MKIIRISKRLITLISRGKEGSRESLLAAILDRLLGELDYIPRSDYQNSWKLSDPGIAKKPPRNIR